MSNNKNWASGKAWDTDYSEFNPLERYKKIKDEDIIYDVNDSNTAYYVDRHNNVHRISKHWYGISDNIVKLGTRDYSAYLLANQGATNNTNTVSLATTLSAGQNNNATATKPTSTASTRATNTVATTADKNSVPKRTVATPTPVFNAQSLYLILSDDTLGKLAKQYNTTVDQLMSWNPDIKDANKIYAGKYLNVNGPLEIHTALQTNEEPMFNQGEADKAKNALDLYDEKQQNNYLDLASSNSYLHHILDNYFKLYINFSENESALPRRKVLSRIK